MSPQPLLRTFDPVEALEQRIEKQGEDIGNYAIARYANLSGDYATAAQYFDEVARAHPYDALMIETAIYSHLRMNDVEAAITLARDLPKAGLKDAELARLTLAVDALARGRDAKIDTIQADAWSSRFHTALARSLTAWSLREEAEDTAVLLQKSAGGGGPALSNISDALSAIMTATNGDVVSALSEFDRLWNERVRLSASLQVEAELLALTGQADMALQRLQTFQDEIGHNPTLALLDAKIRSNAPIELTELTARQGAALSIMTYTTAIGSQLRSDPGIYYSLVLHLNPKLDGARIVWADFLDRAERPQEALALSQTVRSDSPYYYSAQAKRARLLIDAERDDDALAIVRGVLPQAELRNTKLERAYLLQSLDLKVEAERAFSDVILGDIRANAAPDWLVYFSRGAIREQIGSWPEAEADLKRALDLSPNHPSIMNYLGYGWIDRGKNLEAGLKLIEDALKLDPRNGAITDSLGWAHYKLRNFDRAVYYLERATELSPDSAEILDHLGDTYWQVGRYTDAGYQWERALLYATTEDERTRLEGKLNSGLKLVQAAAQSDRLPRP